MQLNGFAAILAVRPELLDDGLGISVEPWVVGLPSPRGHALDCRTSLPFARLIPWRRTQVTAHVIFKGVGYGPVNQVVSAFPTVTHIMARAHRLMVAAELVTNISLMAS